jgi:hypothetical protein
MVRYYVNDRARSDGEHEVHRDGCSFLPALENRTFLGDYETCVSAVKEARKHFEMASGCFYCAPACHEDR